MPSMSDVNVGLFGPWANEGVLWIIDQVLEANTGGRMQP